MKIVNEKEFDEIIKSGLTLVDFYADWCGPCKMLGPVLESVSADYPDVTFVKVNVDDNEELAAEFGIMSIPAVFMFKDGKLVHNFLGAKMEKSVKDELDKAFK